MIKTKRKSATFEDLLVLLVFLPITANVCIRNPHFLCALFHLHSLQLRSSNYTASSAIWWEMDYTGSPNCNLVKQIKHKLSNVNAGCVHVSMFVPAPHVYFKS